MGAMKNASQDTCLSDEQKASQDNERRNQEGIY
jgi:hypothetical protein